MTTAVILAGGKSRRMGRDKLTLAFGGATLLESAAARFAPYFDEVCLSVREPGRFEELGFTAVADTFPGLGPISGLHAALAYAPGDGVFLVAADMPYADPRAALRVMALCGEAQACVLSDGQGRAEPLFGYYKKTLLDTVAAEIRAGRYKMTELVRRIGARVISPAQLGPLWDARLLTNINCPQDYERIANNGYNGLEDGAGH